MSEIFMEREEEIIELLCEVRGVLACHQSSSINSYPASAELLTFLIPVSNRHSRVHP